LSSTRSLVVVLGLVAAACHGTPRKTTASGVPLLADTLVPASTTMVTAWDIPQNPLTDPSLDESKLSKDIRWGYKLFTNTPQEAKAFTPSKLSCANCHLNAGQRERSLPLVGVAGMFPEYNRRSGRLYSLNDRIVDCFWRSENGTGVLDASGLGARGSEETGGSHDVHSSSRREPRVPSPDSWASSSEPRVRSEMLPTPTSKEVLAIAAYITWLARGSAVGKNPTWRGQNTIAASALIPVAKLDRQRGEEIFKERCTSCHGLDGQGVAIGDKKPGPLWGPDSWNDGAGAARVYTLAGIIRYSMPYLNPGGLTDEEAQLVAAFINTQPRPAFPFKPTDYLTEKLPPDSVYYPRR
jgi:thiosulfate dehydrogenase